MEDYSVFVWETCTIDSTVNADSSGSDGHLRKVLEDAGLKSRARKLCYEQLRDLHDRLDVVMFDEILTYLPAKHLEAFVKMNDEKRSRGEIDKFLEENMPNA